MTIAIECQNITDQSDNTIEENICQASGKLYMSENMVLTFVADTNKLTITAEGDNFDVFCAANAIWSRSVTEVNIYGLDEDMNTHDYHKQLSVVINLCQLETQSEIIQNF